MNFKLKNKTKEYLIILILVFSCFLIFLGCKSIFIDPNTCISGIVIDKNGPVSGATIRVQTTKNYVLSDDDGSFILENLTPGKPITVSAWKDGYFCSKVENVSAPKANIEVKLRHYQLTDNPHYKWVPPVDANNEKACINCHPEITKIWLKNAHATSANNPRFLTMYNGTDTLGNKSPQTIFVDSIPLGPGYPATAIGLPPEPDKPYYGPGFVLDTPVITAPGNCSSCHVPGAATEYNFDPNNAVGANKFGVHCDYCHKVADVIIDPHTNLPYPHMPGVRSTELRRPDINDKKRPQLFFGSFDDDNGTEADSFLPLEKESKFCAPCHFGKFFDTVVYNSYGEWLESSYSDPETGKTCQDCHMPSPTIYDGKVVKYAAIKEKGGLKRDPKTIHAHLQLGAFDKKFMEDSLTLKADAEKQDNEIIVNVSITNDNTGHHIPTDSPLRHLILVIIAKDGKGNVLQQFEGSKLPNWAGIGDPKNGYYAGLPGKTYAKVLQDIWTEHFPSAAYWNPTKILSDNRIAAFETDKSTYKFIKPKIGKTEVIVKLYYRRAYKKLMDEKKWDTPDILLAEEKFII